jgi:O-antigen ligase
MIRDHPFLGVGPQNYAYASTVTAAHPHNSLLQWAAEWGVPSAILLTGMVGVGLYLWLTRSRSACDETGPSSTVRAALTASIIAACVHAMLDGITVMPFSQTLLILVAGWALGIELRETGSAPVRARPSRVRLALALSPIAVVFVACAWSSEGRPSRPGLAQWGNEPVHYRPRFWLQSVPPIRRGASQPRDVPPRAARSGAETDSDQRDHVDGSRDSSG